MEMIQGAHLSLSLSLFVESGGDAGGSKGGKKGAKKKGGSFQTVSAVFRVQKWFS